MKNTVLLLLSLSAGNLEMSALSHEQKITTEQTTRQVQEKKTIEPKGNLYILSIGINEYLPKNDRLSFKNCTSDAQKLADFFTEQFNTLKQQGKSEHKVINKLLLNENATKETILQAINEIISHAEPNDYFIFNFSGFTKSLPDTQDSVSTWFVPYGLTNFLDTAEIFEKGISLVQLKDLFQFIPADNQLFITEAGNTPKFSREFSKSLIESNPSIAAISARNRIIMIPFIEGYDSFNCNNRRIEGGALTHIITTLSSDQNIFGLFEQESIRRETEYALRNNEMNCKSFDNAYFEIFYEQKFIEDLKYYLPEQIMQSRGADPEFEEVELMNKINSKNALIIGTDKYKSSKQWSYLSNPVIDSKAVADAMQNLYGYSVKLLIDPPLDSIYHWLIYYSNNLVSSDQFFLFIAGHGDFDEMLDDGMIVCHDSRPSKEDRARNTYIQFSKLSRLVNKMLPKQILVVLDVCFGGTFDEQVTRLSKRSGYTEMAADAYLNNKLSLKTRLYISSGGKKEVPDGYKGKHSPFAYKLLEALRTAGGSYGLLSSGSMYEFVKKLPSEPLIGSFGDDEPGSEFLLIPKTK
jgi:hypothetical protein